MPGDVDVRMPNAGDVLAASEMRALFLALRDGSLKVARTLVDWPRTNVETRTPNDESPLMMAALKGYTEIARKLVERDADVNKTGWTPLHYAATNGHLAVMELLLENHAYIDAESPNGTTPLMMAAHYGTTAAVKLLLEAGADRRAGIRARHAGVLDGAREDAFDLPDVEDEHLLLFEVLAQRELEGLVAHVRLRDRPLVDAFLLRRDGAAQVPDPPGDPRRALAHHRPRDLRFRRRCPVRRRPSPACSPS